MLVIDIYAMINDQMAVMRQMSPENSSKQVFLRDKTKILLPSWTSISSWN
jgi:hypothetical protein